MAAAGSSGIGIQTQCRHPFDDNRLDEETRRLLMKLADMQLNDGAWPWFPGGQGNDYITLYITTGFGRLRHLGVQLDPAMAIRSLTRLDAWVTERYNDIRPEHRDQNHLSRIIALYLYGRSFFLQDRPIARTSRGHQILAGPSDELLVGFGESSVASAPGGCLEAVWRSGDGARNHAIDQGTIRHG
ncbi:MAG: hypothetical protein R3C05_16955 [Pirellulaceae bacterium]